MKPKEEISATIPLPASPVRRIDATEKAVNTLEGIIIKNR